MGCVIRQDTVQCGERYIGVSSSAAHRMVKEDEEDPYESSQITALIANIMWYLWHLFDARGIRTYNSAEDRACRSRSGIAFDRNSNAPIALYTTGSFFRGQQPTPVQYGFPCSVLSNRRRLEADRSSCRQHAGKTMSALEPLSSAPSKTTPRN